MKKWWFRDDFLFPNGLWLVVIPHILFLIGGLTHNMTFLIIGYIVLSIIAIITTICSILNMKVNRGT